MKRLFAMTLALVMIFSLSITAFATGENPAAINTATDTGTGYITIDNSGVGREYKVYKIFNARFQEGVLDENGKLAVDYKMTPDDVGFSALFNAEGTPATGNTYFTYEKTSNTVQIVDGSVDTEVINYLKGLVEAHSFDKEGVWPKTITGTGKAVTINNVPHGYYLITTSAEGAPAATITIDTNTPGVVMVDKNQQPTAFGKYIWDAKTGKWTNQNTANIGDEVQYKIEVQATNYFKDHKIRYYQVHDEKGTGIWADFGSIEVKIIDPSEKDPIILTKGYFLDMGTEGANDRETDKLGTWVGDMNDAQWYLVRLGDDSFRFTIPWQAGHTIDEKNGVYSIAYAQDGQSLYSSDVKIEITYKAALEADAAIGGGVDNLINKARITWTCGKDGHGIDFVQVNTDTFGFGLLKEDAKDGTNLANAKFRLYKADGTTPVNVVPTEIDGVYMIDKAPAKADDETSDYNNMNTPRKQAPAKVKEYLDGKEHDNLVVSQLNGKLVVLGLDAGNYVLKEVEAPPSYNALNHDIDVTVGSGTTSIFKVFADKEGKVADIQQADGTYSENVYRITEVVVENSRGAELPSTGGEGAAMLITIGAVIACAFAVLLITQKKMSIYKD